MKIALAQLGVVVGDLDGNRQKIAQAYEKAVASGARICVTPELSLLGYPPLDLLDRPDVFARSEEALQALIPITRGQPCALVVGHVGKGKSKLTNCLSVIEDGKIVHTQSKILLPTYDVFDESRYFEAGGKPTIWNCDGKKVAFLICEDLWREGVATQYERDPVAEVKALGPELLIAIAASPFEKEKVKLRESLHKNVAVKISAPLVYVNLTGATDEVMFDGRSFVLDQSGAKRAALPPFEDSILTVDLDQLKSLSVAPAPSEMEVLALGLVDGIKSYFKRTGFSQALIGLSGGIDSALVAVLAVRALGAKNVHGIAMPSQYSSDHSLEDAQILARNLGMTLETQSIESAFGALGSQIAKLRFGKLADLASENLQSRLRGLILMTVSNHENRLVLTTGNKSEIAMGYCTLYGDMVGALAPIGDLYKTEVYALSTWINEHWGHPIPERSITKAPSAELRPNQTDQDSLPPYEVLDPILRSYLEEGQPVSKETASLIRTLERNEYKRRQAAPALKTSAKAFGIGRRIPVAKVWDQK